MRASEKSGWLHKAPQVLCFPNYRSPRRSFATKKDGKSLAITSSNLSPVMVLKAVRERVDQRRRSPGENGARRYLGWEKSERHFRSARIASLGRDVRWIASLLGSAPAPRDEDRHQQDDEGPAEQRRDHSPDLSWDTEKVGYTSLPKHPVRAQCRC